MKHGRRIQLELTKSHADLLDKTYLEHLYNFTFDIKTYHLENGIIAFIEIVRDIDQALFLKTEKNEELTMQIRDLDYSIKTREEWIIKQVTSILNENKLEPTDNNISEILMMKKLSVERYNINNEILMRDSISIQLQASNDIISKLTAKRSELFNIISNWEVALDTHNLNKTMRGVQNIDVSELIYNMNLIKNKELIDAKNLLYITKSTDKARQAIVGNTPNSTNTSTINLLTQRIKAIQSPLPVVKDHPQALPS